LDTNIVSDLIRKPNGRVKEKIAEIGEASICISLIVASEIRFGCAKKASKLLTERAELILGALPVLPLEEPVDAHYADIRNRLEAQGQPIGPNDLLIAAHARTLGLTLVTANEAAFGRVQDLQVENWLSGDDPPPNWSPGAVAGPTSFG
jgi:tRNA(fMet)-specific endonuclease VapC